MKRVPSLPPDTRHLPRRLPQKWAEPTECDDSTSTPKRGLLGFDAVALTPLMALLVLFLLPMAKLQHLHLALDVVEDDEELVANQTINEPSDGDLGDILIDTPPVFTRKRAHDDSVALTDTPATLASDHSEYSLKVLFLDLTPCPQPVRWARNGRKRLRFSETDDDDATTPTVARTSRHRLLNLSLLVKTPAKLSLLDTHTPGGLGAPATPLSQLTPANSQHPTPEKPHELVDLVLGSGHLIGQLRAMAQELTPATPSALAALSTPDVSMASPDALVALIKPPTSEFPRVTPRATPGLTPRAKTHPQLLFVTPDNPPHPLSRQLRTQYLRQQYLIVGEFPVTLAGLMDEADDDVHVGDKRIVVDDDDDLRADFYRANRLPIPPPLYHSQQGLDEHEKVAALTPEAVRRFYEAIAPDDLAAMLRSERVRWHPDKAMAAVHPAAVVLQVSLVVNSLYQEEVD